MKAYSDYDSGGLLHGRYAKVHDISEGSYGLVSLAKDTANQNTLVAVKYLYPPSYKKKKLFSPILDNAGRSASSPAKLRSKSSSGKIGERDNDSANEIAIHKILGHHPNIPDLIDSFESCLVLEYCSKGDLYEAMQDDQGPTTTLDIKDVFSQIIDAISYCHSKSIYHRDLKPENILIADDWTIKVCDWGLATTERIITNPAEFDIGSERYMAPELFDSELEFYDASKVDVWSLGIILLTLVFHKNPFQVANYSDKRFLQFSANREALFDFFSSMTNEMFGALRFCLNLDPSNRDLAGFHDELQGINYFTIDEEYTATHSDEDCDDEDDPNFDQEAEELTFVADQPVINIQDEVFDFDKDTKDTVQDESTEILQESKISLCEPEQSSEKSERFLLPETDHSYSNQGDTENDDSEQEIPYNRRADALLSPSTQTRPIPIGVGKQIRNTRKPFGVASYNKYNTLSSAKSGQSHNLHGNKFHREDFFTPRSIFSHYMDKYGELRDHKDYSKNEKKRRRRPGKQSWKKRGGWSHASHNNEALNDDAHSKAVHTSRRKRQSRLSMPTNGGIASVFSPQNGNYLGSENLPFTNTAHCSKSGQKYKPPFLRSPPVSRKSPAIHALSEGFDQLQLNDSEVFVLEDDIHGATDQQNWRKIHLDDREFETVFGPQEPRLGEHHGSSRRYLTGKPDFSSRTSGKYVPPFRRGSYGGVGIATEKRRSFQPSGTEYPVIQQAIEDEGASEIIPRDLWLLRKDWRALK